MNVVRAIFRLRIPEVSEMTTGRFCGKSRLLIGLNKFLDHDVRTLAEIHDRPLYVHSDSTLGSNLAEFHVAAL